jgi:hypothetical protein
VKKQINLTLGLVLRPVNLLVDSPFRMCPEAPPAAPEETFPTGPLPPQRRPSRTLLLLPPSDRGFLAQYAAFCLLPATLTSLVLIFFFLSEQLGAMLPLTHHQVHLILHHFLTAVFKNNYPLTDPPPHRGSPHRCDRGRVNHRCPLISHHHPLDIHQQEVELSKGDPSRRWSLVRVIPASRLD